MSRISTLRPTDEDAGEGGIGLSGCAMRDRRGMFQLFVTVLAGDDVGFLRATRDVLQAGGGLRWTP